MAGHSKWANIQHRKGAQDKKRGKIFTKLIREITVAARMGGGDVSANSRLRLAIDKALGANMPRDTIDRAVKRGSGNLDGMELKEVIYEGYGPGGVAVLVKSMTDNSNRTVNEVRHAFSKAGGNLGASGSVAYLFADRGRISFAEGVDEDKIMEIALESGAEDVIVNDDTSIDVITLPDNFVEVRDAVTEAGLTFEYAGITMIPSTKVELDKENAEKVLKMIDVLEDLDDTQEVHTNSEVSDEVAKELEGT
ncbi:MAG: YebC/PmpR family DNA-binding transcriptional regulator [Gammaproteobacteria bacterium]|jgi:YebC/PmpR family DNA-binding regulatory protein